MARIVTLGEAMIRLAPPNFQRFEQAVQLDVEVGGSELNTAVGLARLGHQVEWVSRVPTNPLGRLLLNRVRQTGVGVGHVLPSDRDRLGLYFLEFGAAPRPSGIVYDRADSAMSKLQPGMLDWDQILAGADWFHVTGITPALGAGVRSAVAEALRAAQRLRVPVSLEVNYRAQLWSFSDAGGWLRESLPFAHSVITNPDELKAFFGIEAPTLEAATRELSARYPNLHAIAVTLRETPSVWKNRFTAVALAGGGFYQTRQYEVEIVDRLGTGDAFDAGWIHGLLQHNPQQALDMGVAMAALKHTLPGDLPWITGEEVQTLLESDSLRIRR